MKHLIEFTFQSLWNRKLSTFLTLLSIALSVCLLLGVERVRHGAKKSFQGVISQTDLIVGARGSPMQLLMYSLYHLGQPTNNVSWESYQEITSDPLVKWSIPLSMGDSHQNYRVVGTTQAMFDHYRYRGDFSLEFESGKSFVELKEAVVGATVAKKLGYQVGKKLVLTHGIGGADFGAQTHDDHPFEIVGILRATQTPLDQSIFVSLQGIEAIHDEQAEHHSDNDHESEGDESEEAIEDHATTVESYEITQITAFILGLKERIQVLNVQRKINEYEYEPLTAILPALVLSELWLTLSFAENALRFISMFVVLVGLLCMLIAIFTTLNERRREMAILRSIGAGSRDVFVYMLAESLVITFLGILLGVVFLFSGLLVFQPVFNRIFGLYLSVDFFSMSEVYLILGVFVSGVVLGCIPAWQASRKSLQDGLSIRL